MVETPEADGLAAGEDFAEVGMARHLGGELVYEAASRRCPDMRVDHGRLDVGVTEQFLHIADVGTGFEEVCGERVTQHVRRDAFENAGITRGLLHGILDPGVAHPPSVTVNDAR